MLDLQLGKSTRSWRPSSSSSRPTRRSCSRGWVWNRSEHLLLMLLQQLVPETLLPTFRGKIPQMAAVVELQVI